RRPKIDHRERMVVDRFGEVLLGQFDDAWGIFSHRRAPLRNPLESADAQGGRRDCGHLRRNKKKNAPSCSPCCRSWLPVCFANASKSRTDAGSVDRMRSTSPLAMPLRAFLERRTGKGQFKPRASTSRSNRTV